MTCNIDYARFKQKMDTGQKNNKMIMARKAQQIVVWLERNTGIVFWLVIGILYLLDIVKDKEISLKDVKRED